MATAPLNRVLGHLRPTLGLTGDADLLSAFRATRDAAAFEAIVRRHGPTVLNACRQVLRDEADVEDAFQATFLVLFKNAQAIRQGHSLRSWLFGVAHRVSVNARCRRAKREARERPNAKVVSAFGRDMHGNLRGYSHVKVSPPDGVTADQKTAGSICFEMSRTLPSIRATTRLEPYGV